MKRILLYFIYLASGISISFVTGCSTSKKITSFNDIAEPISSPGWITFKESAEVNPEEVFRQFPELFQLAPGNEMTLESKETDSLSITVYRFQQYYKSILVENAEFLIHAKGNKAISANGEIEINFQPETIKPGIPEEEALQILIRHMNADKFFRDEDFVQSLENAGADENYFPKGNLMFTEKPETRERLLAWMFKAYVFPFNRSAQVYIDAANGTIIKEVPLIPNCYGASGNTTFRGAQNFNTAKANIPSFGERFILMDDCHGNKLHLLNWNTFGDTREIFDSDNNWSDNSIPAVTSFWALGICYDYFDLVHNRKSYDGKNSNMVIVNDGSLGNNANGGSGFINIGLGSTGNSNDDYNTTDIVGHEYTHSVVQTSAKLAYDASKESAALNESFCDIFGTLVERWEELNASTEWIIGDDKGCTGGAICRDLKNPKSFNGPDTYKGTNWMTTGIDPHNNGCVQNRWFALLTDGGSGTNSELGTSYNITGLGIYKTRRIAYRTLTRYLTADSDFNDAVNGSIHAAEDLFGMNSTEVGEVTKAWCAVGLCPYTVPKQPDIFDKPGGNPNPVSPDNNNTYAGATPLGTGSYNWSAETRPRLKINKLSIYPLNDIDYFKIQFPSVETIGGECFTPGISFYFGTDVNVKIYLNGSLFQSYKNVSFFPLYMTALSAEEFVLEISAVFPGQILEYNLEVSYFVHFNSMCYQTEPPNKWEAIQDCPMCDLQILSDIQTVILEPLYRDEDRVTASDYFIYWNGDGNLEIPINIIEGNNLQVFLVDEAGRTLTSANRKDSKGNLVLQSPGLREGVYSLKFSGFGNGTKISVQAPGR